MSIQTLSYIVFGGFGVLALLFLFVGMGKR